MAKANFIQMVLGSTPMAVFDFPKAGDVLDVHVHETEELNHITVITQGSVRVLGDDSIAGDILPCGTVRAWPVGIAHGFEALEDDTQLKNISVKALG